MNRSRLPAGVLVAAALAAMAGCSTTRTSEPPTAGYERGGIPDLRGQRVLLLPPQLVRGGHPDVEREILHALAGRSGAVTWIGPDELRRRARGTPGMEFDPDHLPVEQFQLGELDRVGDPLFGMLYRMAAVENATFALLPIEIREREEEDGRHVVEVVAAFLQPRSGRVLWFGIMDGRPGPPGDLAATASTAEALARRIVR